MPAPVPPPFPPTDTDTDDVADTPRCVDPGRAERLTAAFAACGYTVDGVRALLGEDASAALDRDELVPADVVTARLLNPAGAARDAGASGAAAAAGTAARERVLAALIRLLLLGRPVPADAFDAADSDSGPTTGLVGDLEACRVVQRGPRLTTAEPDAAPEPDAAATYLHALVDLRPYEADDGTALWVAADLGALQTDGPLRRDHVLGIGHASLTLAQITDRRPVDRALDLGTGCGIQTFHLLRHARHVTATDLSERALAYARFNLLLNAAALDLDPADLSARVDLRRGSLLDPVAGERFDLVVSNPPFVITPRAPGELPAARYTYRDGGQAGDRLVRDLVRALPHHLVAGGTAQLLGNWEVPIGAQWDDVLASGWFPDAVDRWVIQRDAQSPAEYAELWLRDAAQAADRDDYRRAYGDYLADFASRGVDGIGFGMIWLRRPDPSRATAPLHRLEEIGHAVEQPLGPVLAAAVARHDRFPAAADLSDVRLLVAPDVTEERYGTPGAPDPAVILLRQGGGLRRTLQATTALAGFVGACDGELTAGQIAGALAVLLDPVEAGFTGALLDQVRDAVVDGFLIPAP